MKRILQVYPQLNNAGTEMVIMNLYRNIDRSRLQFDFCVQKPGELDDVVREMGGKIYYIEKSSRYAEALQYLFREHPEYQVIHTHTHKEMGLVLKQAAKAGVPFRIAHSHNFRGDLPGIVRFYKMLSGHDIEKYATHFLACSREAARWLFPLKYRQCTVWKNGIEMERFLFSEEKRANMRRQLHIPEDARVICHVGRFAEEKNHKRILAVVNHLLCREEKLYAVLVGVGPLLEEIRCQARSERILFLGNRTDVPDILCASDVFLFPSLYEGFGIVAVEAQASGICCIASENVPEAADIGTGLFERLPLSADDAVWEGHMEKALRCPAGEERLERSEKAMETVYNIRKVVQKAQDFYLKLQ